MKQQDFPGEPGAYHVLCNSCDADTHVLKWNYRTHDGTPRYCPFCGSEDAWQTYETVERSNY